MSKAFTAVIVIVGLIGLFAIVYFAAPIFLDKAFEKALNSMHKKTIVAENVQITDDWTEITSDNPLEPTKMVQKVQLLIEGYKHDIHNSDFGNITLSDGTKINPEIEIVDESGKVYKLKDSQRVGDLVGFSVDEKLHGSHSFPKDVTYKAIRIRSDKPFQCKKIIWYDYDLK